MFVVFHVFQYFHNKSFRGNEYSVVKNGLENAILVFSKIKSYDSATFRTNEANFPLDSDVFPVPERKLMSTM